MVRLPNLMICTDSMHSKEKIRLKYPHVNKSMVEQLYGLHTKGIKRSMWDIRKSQPEMFNFLRMRQESEYEMLNSINLTEFYIETAPVLGLNLFGLKFSHEKSSKSVKAYYMFECKMERTIDCRKNWKLKQTAQGTCLALQPNDAYEYKKLEVERKRKRNKRGATWGKVGIIFCS